MRWVEDVLWVNKKKLDGTRTYVLLMCSSEHVYMKSAAKYVGDAVL